MSSGARVSIGYFPSELPWLQRDLPSARRPRTAPMGIVIDLLIILLIISNLALTSRH